MSEYKPVKIPNFIATLVRCGGCGGYFPINEADKIRHLFVHKNPICRDLLATKKEGK